MKYQFRWTVKIRQTKASTSPGVIGSTTYDAQEYCRVMQYRDAKDEQAKEWSAWTDVPDA